MFPPVCWATMECRHETDTLMVMRLHTVMGEREEGSEEGVSWCVCVLLLYVVVVVVCCCCCVGVVCVLCVGGGGGRDTNRTIWLLVPSEVSLRRAETEQLYQARQLIRGIGHVLFSTYSQT